MKLKIAIRSYRQLCPHTCDGTVKWNPSVSAHSPQPSAIYGVSEEECARLREVFPLLKYTDVTQNTYVQIRMVKEIMVREICGLLWGSTQCTCQLTVLSITVLECGVILRLTLALNCIISG
jgi:hypothetical protein